MAQGYMGWIKQKYLTVAFLKQAAYQLSPEVHPDSVLHK